jgi:hypothetical protein
MMTTRFAAMGGLLAAGALLLSPEGGARAASVRDTTGAATTTGVLTSLAPSWQHAFTLDWSATTRHGGTLVEGHIRNAGIFPARRIRLLVEALDASGNVVGQHLAWLLPPELTPGARQYFAVPIPEGAASHRVSVFSFDWQRGA